MTRTVLYLVPAVAVAACSSGPPEPPSLEYASPTESVVRYDVSDTTVVSVSMMGQGMELSQEGTGSYAVTFAPSSDGLVVELTVEELDARLNQPLGAPVDIDASFVEGPVRFTLDRRGSATMTAAPDVRPEASQLVSGLALAHTFFPRLPGRAATPGETWTDTIRYEGGEGSGSRSETHVVNYVVTGDTVVDGRALLAIAVTGTSTSNSGMELSGMRISQESEVAVTGEYLWDVQNGVMFGSTRTATGTGTVSVPVVPTPLPIRIESTQTARLGR